METNNKNFTKMKRKKFFVSAGTGVFGFMLMKTFPFNLFKNSAKIESEKVSGIKVKLNPHAVSRNNSGANNG